MRPGRVAVAGMVALVVVVGGCTADKKPTPAPSDFKPGAVGIGDPYFPTYGNGGYDVAGYDLKLRYDPKSGELSGTATITAAATQDLSRFDFDFLGPLKVGKVTVDGRKAAYARTGAQELVITPDHGITKGRTFTVDIAYSGVPQLIDDPALGVSGWIATHDGAVALSQQKKNRVEKY